MAENSEYWKELLGDSYDPDIMDEILGSDGEDREGGAVPAAGQGTSANGLDLSVSEPDAAGAGEDGKFVDFPLEPPAPEEAPPSRDEYNEDSDTGSDDFAVNFDFDDEYRDVPENRPLRKRRERRTGCLGGILYALFIVCISLLLASLAWLAATDVLGFGGQDQTVNVTVPNNFTIDDVAKLLHDSGLIKYQFLFKIYANFSKAEGKIAPGTYVLNENLDYMALVKGMTKQQGVRATVDVAIPEGYTETQIFTLLEKNGVCTAADLWTAATNYDFKYDFLDSGTIGDKKRLEGYLFPDTYTFYVNDTPTRVIDKMLHNFSLKFTPDMMAQAQEMGRSVQDIVIIASMIEKEAGNDDERPTIASVIYNRLKDSADFPNLQIDATYYYAVEGTNIPPSKNVDSPYNTYIVEGLPVGPISNPGLASIKAALDPAYTKYYYYALNKNKSHDFFTDYDSFVAFVNSDQYGG